FVTHYLPHRDDIELSQLRQHQHPNDTSGLDVIFPSELTIYPFALPSLAAPPYSSALSGRCSHISVLEVEAVAAAVAGEGRGQALSVEDQEVFNEKAASMLDDRTLETAGEDSGEDGLDG
ncbi:hypothetical protein BV22DRAFT_1046519, partial [Leucogyrophana mollusca]